MLFKGRLSRVRKDINKEVFKCFFFPNLLPSSGCETLQFFEDTNSVSCGLDDIGLGQHILGECLQGNILFSFRKVKKIKTTKWRNTCWR